MAIRDYEKMFREAEASPEYWAEVAVGDFTEEICRLLSDRKITRAELARRLGTTPAYVTKVLRGNANFTLLSMAKIALALEGQIRLHLAPKGSYTVWKDLLGEPEQTWTTQYESRITVPEQPGIQASWADLVTQFNETQPIIDEKKILKGSEAPAPLQGGKHDPSTAAA